MSKQARWERFHLLTGRAFRAELGYGADHRRIDPRSFGRLRGEDACVGSLRPLAPSPLGRFRDAA